MVRRQAERRCEADIDLYFLARHLPVPTSREVGNRMDSAGLDRVQCGERGAELLGRERQLTSSRVAAIEGDVRWGVLARRHLGRAEGRHWEGGAARVGIGGKDAVDLYEDLRNGGRSP